jgi:nucleotidyltransferase/DNA polymerase involved in DNA repair
MSFAFTSEKAGMTGLDRTQINNIILNATKDSRIYKKNEQVLQKIKQEGIEMNKRLEEFHNDKCYYFQIESIASAKLEQIKSERRFDKIWLHLDMDMYFAAIEIRDDPSLADKPIAIGNKSMISTSNYIARKYGVRSGMPGFLGLKLCPQLKLIQSNYHKYQIESEKIMNILNEYDDNIEVIGLDEAYIDLTEYCKERNIENNKEQLSLIINEIKIKIYDQTKLSCSIGIACNKMLAKICSDYSKPNGFYYLDFNSKIIENFMKDLNIRKIPFIGEKSEQRLNNIGISKCKDLLDKYVDLYRLFDEDRFEFFMKSALGIGSSEHSAQQESKSISRGISFQISNDKTLLINTCKELAIKVYNDIQKENKPPNAKTLSVQVIDYNEEKRIKCVTKQEGYYDNENDIVNGSVLILEELLQINKWARMIRVKVSGFNRLNKEKEKNVNSNEDEDEENDYHANTIFTGKKKKRNKKKKNKNVKTLDILLLLDNMKAKGGTFHRYNEDIININIKKENKKETHMMMPLNQVKTRKNKKIKYKTLKMYTLDAFLKTGKLF